MTSELTWYAELREDHRPERVRVLLIGESAPDPNAAERRFFYAPVLTQHDNLFRGVVQAFYGSSPGRAGDKKGPWLGRLRADGVFLIDLVRFPVNRLAPNKRENERLRRAARRAHAPACVRRAQELDPLGVIVCHKPTFAVLSKPLRAAGLSVLHERPIPFPLGNTRAEFVREVSSALDGLRSK